MVRESIPREERLRRLMEEDEREMTREEQQTQTDKARRERDKRDRSESRDDGVEGERATKKKKKMKEQENQVDKRPRGDEVEDEDDESSPPRAAKRQKKVVASKEEAATQRRRNKKDAVTDNKDNDGTKDEKKKKLLLQMKVSKRKGADELDQALNEDFNALKIVKPVLRAMPGQAKKKMTWNEDDSDVERDRLIRQDQQERNDNDNDEEEMDPTKWRTVSQAMFNVKEFEVERKEKTPARRNDLELPDKWAGRANYKRFRVRVSLSHMTRSKLLTSAPPFSAQTLERASDSSRGPTSGRTRDPRCRRFRTRRRSVTVAPVRVLHLC